MVKGAQYALDRSSSELFDTTNRCYGFDVCVDETNPGEYLVY